MKETEAALRRLDGQLQQVAASALTLPATSAGKYLCDDGTWQTIAGGGDMLKATYDSNADGVIAAAQLDASLVVTTDGRLSDARTPVSHNNTYHSATYIIQSDAVVPNAPITGAQKTKVTYDAKGLVTSGTDATATDVGAEASGAVSTHATLTTGVHGVGAGTVAKVSDITKTQVGLGNADNTSDAAKPISTATQTALDLKAPSTSIANAALATMTTKTYKGNTTAGTATPTDVAIATLKSDLALAKADVGLGNADNTADTSKAVLSATKLAVARTIGGISFDGSTDVVAPTWKTGITTRDINAVSGTVNVAHGLGRVPSFVRVKASLVQGANTTEAEGSYDGANHAGLCTIQQEGTSTAITDTIYSSTAFELGFSAATVVNPYTGANRQTATITVNATNIIFTWTKTGTVASAVANIKWECT